MGNSNARKTFAENLKRYAKESGKNQSQIAAALGCSSSTVSDWFAGNKYPRPERMVRLAELLKVPLSVLTDGEKIPPTLTEEEPMNPDIRLIARAGKKMTAEETQALLKYAQFMFPEAFNDG